MSVNVTTSVCLCVSTYECLWMCKSMVCQISLACIPKSAKCKNGMCVCACVCVFVCVHGVPNIKLVKCKNSICLCVPMSVCVHVSCVWYTTYKLSIFDIFANESKSTKCEIF